MSAADRFTATYLIETPLDPRKGRGKSWPASSRAGLSPVSPARPDELRDRTRAAVIAVEELDSAAEPSLPNAWLARKDASGPWRRARITLSFPVDNVGANLPTLASIVAGNLFDLGEVTGLRLESMALPAAYRRLFPLPTRGIAGTRRATGVTDGPMIGSIIKPNVGLRPYETAELVGRLCAAGLDFIKDDEICADPVHAPLAQRVPAVMAAVRRHQDRTGKAVMVAFNITAETDQMRRHAELVEREGGSCVMVSLNWCGFSAVETLRRSTSLALHGHRNGFGALSRHPLLGIGFQAYQTLWRLAGVDHMHVHGLQGKFAQEDEEVVTSAKDCVTPLTDGIDDRVLPAFSSGQWAGTAQPTWDAIGHDDLLFMAGGGILAHPGGPAAGVASIRQAWQAVAAGVPLTEAAKDHDELAQALAFFGKGAG